MCSDPKVALDTIQGSTDQNQQRKAWNIIQQEIVDQLPFVPAWRGNYGFAYDARKFRGVELTYYGQIAFWGPMYSLSA